MEKTITIRGKMITNYLMDAAGNKLVMKDRREHVKAWREIYQEVRRQWAEAESCSSRDGKYARKYGK